MIIEPLDLAKQAREALIDKKGEKVVILDVSSISNVTNFFVLSNGTSTPHLKALAAEVERVLKEQGVMPYRRAGTSESSWLVVDYVHVVVHIFSEEMRDYYALERLWRDAPKIEA